VQPRAYSRRQLLLTIGQGSAATAALSVLAACGGAATLSTATTAAQTTSAAAAPATAAASTASASASQAATSAAQASASVAPATQAVARGTPTLVYQTWWAEMVTNLTPLFPKFEQQYGAKLDVQVSDYNDWTNKLPVEFASNTPPDTMNANNFGHVKLFDQGVFLELGSRLKVDKIDLTHDYGLIGLESWCGKNYAMPFDNDPRQVYFNKTLIRAAGAKDPWDDLKGQWTLDDMAEIAVKTTKRGADNKATQWGLQMGYTGMSESNGMFVWTFGGTWADFEKMQFTLDSPESIAAHNYVLDLVKTKQCVLTTADNDALTKAGVKDPFREGKTALYIRASANVEQNIKQMQGEFDWDVAPFPGRKQGELGVPIVSGNPNEAAAASKQTDLAYNFLKWLAGTDVQTYFAQNKVEVPSLNAVKPMYASSPPPAHVNVFSDTYKHPYGIHFRMYRTLDAYNEYAKEIAPVFTGQASMETTLRSLNSLLNASFVQYGSCNPYAGMQVPIKP
jgi:ABC-type glycerol-3-phosphate transport system substrate-binding protein